MTKLYQAFQWSKNKVKNNYFTTDLTFIVLALGYDFFMDGLKKNLIKILTRCSTEMNAKFYDL